MIRLERVTLAVGTRELLVDAELHVHPGDRVGIVGPNGTGKTTLLRALIGELPLERGTITRRAGATFGYLPQKAVSGSSRPVWDEAQAHMHRYTELRARLASAQAAVEAGTPGAVEKLGDAQEAWRLAGGWALDEKIGEVLHGLGFGPDTWQRSCDTFSGGWQMRIALARMLLSEPDVLLLDEPTNHLDLTARSWLARYLAELGRTLVIVSHDRHLLDKVCTRTVEVERQQLTSFRGNLSAWMIEKAQREIALLAAYESQQDEIAHLQRYIDRFGAKASKASQAQSKKKALDRIERIEIPDRTFRARLVLPEAPPCSEEVVELRGASIGWEEGPDVLTAVELLLLRGQRVAVLGANGTGKSTLLHALSGRLPLRAGRRRLGKDVRFGIFSQDLAQALPASISPLDHVLSAAPAVTPQRARAALGALGLRGDDAMRPIGGLSGGEKARVVLATFAVQPANVLLLDEPTNHLDTTTVDVLVEALEEFEGAMLIVTHDRFLVERLATHVVQVRDGVAEIHEGVRPEDLEPPARARAAVSAAAGVSEGETARRRGKDRNRLQRQLDQKFAEAEKVEAEMGRIDAELVEVGGDYGRASKLAGQRTTLEQRLESIFDEMTALEASLNAP